MTGIEIAALVPLAFWVLLALDRRRAWPREAVLPAADAAEPAEDEAPAVTVVIPARDEAVALPETLPTLLAQKHPRLSVILVDDGSTDGTAGTARRLAHEMGAADRLRVIEAPPPPPGWTGKIHALARGVEAAGDEPEWLLFTDADIRHRPGSVRALLVQARGAESGGPYDLVSVMALLSTASFWERLLIPPFVFFFQLLYPFRQVGRPGSRVAAAAGGCVLVRREVLEAAGGLAAIRGAVIDDVALARVARDAGGRLWLGFDPGIVSVRSYRDLGGIWQMVARSAFIQLGRRYDLLLLVLAGLGLLFVAPPPMAAAGLAGALAVPESPAAASWARAAVWGGLAWGLSGASLLPSVRHHRVPGRYALTLPFAALLYGLMTASSAWRHATGAGATWKGRAYRREEAGRGPEA